MKVSAIVEIAMQCFENFGGKMPQIPPPSVARLDRTTSYNHFTPSKILVGCGSDSFSFLNAAGNAYG